MKEFNIHKWSRGKPMPDGIQREWVAESGEIDGETYIITLKDATSVSGRVYKSVTIRAPYQGRGKSLHAQINGVELNLGWNGSNSPRRPKKPRYANYHVRPVSDDDMRQMKRRPDRPRVTPGPPKPKPEPVPDVYWKPGFFWRKTDLGRSTLPDDIKRAVIRNKRVLRVFFDGVHINMAFVVINGTGVKVERKRGGKYYQGKITQKQYEGLTKGS